MAVPQTTTKSHPSVGSKAGSNARSIPPPSGPALSMPIPQKPPAVVEDRDSKTPKSSKAEVGLESAIEKLDLQATKPNEEVPVSAGSTGNPKASSSSEDEQSHVSGSSSKLQSFDTKSIASVTTFQMDEKESLRPDDSASVQAAEEDESFVNSRVGSELGQPSVSVKRGPVILPGNAPRFADTGLSPAVNLAQNPALKQMSFTSGELLSTPDPSPVPITPDDKLLEAMGTPKDRLLLLQMEEKILAFMQIPRCGKSQCHGTKSSSLTINRAEFLDLPPQNSFGRLLAHKLADYYGLEHYVGNDNNIVRLYRTPVSRLYGPLHESSDAFADKS